MGSIPNNKSTRLQGIDLARGLAIFAMIIIDFRAFFCVKETSPVWLFHGLEYMDRRAAVVLVMLAGVGMTLLVKNAGIYHSRKVFFKRAVFLILSGGLLTQIWSADILHYYGVFIFIGIIFGQMPGKRLLAAAAVFWLTGFVRFLDLIAQGLENIDPESFAGMVSDLFFTGYYPVFPWACLYLFGMWLGRQHLDKLSFLFKLLVSGLVMMVICGAAADFMPGAMARAALSCGSSRDQAALIYMVWAELTGMDLTLPSPFSIVSGLGTGLFVISLSLIWAASFGQRIASYFIFAGKSTLTLYVLHVLWINFAEHVPQIREDYAVLPVVAGAILFFGLYQAVIRLWLKSHSNAPLEWAMRHFPYLDKAWFFPKKPLAPHAKG